MNGLSSSEQRPAVVIFRDLLLPLSETFIAEQAGSLQRYQPVFAGTRLVAAGAGLPVSPAELAGGGAASRILRAALGRPDPAWLSRLRRWSPRLVHAHFGYDGFLALPLAAGLQIPLMVTFHGYDATIHRPRSPAHAAFLLMRQRVFRQAHRIVAVSEFIRSELLRSGCPEEKVAVRYIGVDVERFHPPQTSARDPVILFVGRLVEKKGCGDLIAAMASVLRVHPDARLVILGDGPLRPGLEASAAPLGSAVRFEGRVSHAEVAGWMQRASILCAPSRRTGSGEAEGLPMTVVEAMASGTPIVATRHAGIPEAVQDGENGFLVPERAQDALAAALVRLLTDAPLWQAFSSRARSNATSRFSLRRCTASLEDLYDDLVAS